MAMVKAGSAVITGVSGLVQEFPLFFSVNRFLMEVRFLCVFHVTEESIFWFPEGIEVNDKSRDSPKTNHENEKGRRTSITKCCVLIGVSATQKI